MAKSPVREYAILYAGKNGRSSSGSSILGGAAITSTPQHALDGPEHTWASDLARLNASTDAHGLLPKLSGNVGDGLRGDGTWAPVASDAELNIEGGQDVVKPHGLMGSTEAFDPTDGNVHTGTLDADCTATISAPAGSGAATLEWWITQDGVGGHGLTIAATGGSVINTTTPDTTAGVTVRYILERIPGTTNDWKVDLIGGSAVTYGTPALTLGTANAAGSTDESIRRDATIATFDATVPAAIGTAATGAAAKAARRDHVHPTGAGTPTTSAIGDAAAAGSGPAAAMTDHVHGREALSTATPLVESGSGAVGTGTKSSREDHVHPAAASSGSGASFTPIGQETRISDGSTVLWALDNDFEADSVQAFNLTSGKALVVTETLPNSVTIGAAGTAGDTLSFAYAASVL